MITWINILEEEFSKEYMVDLRNFLERERLAGKKIFPDSKDIFAAFDLCPLSSTKVVIVGQDPYTKEGQAHGLSFSVKRGVKIPPSLKNIYKEIGIKTENGCLEEWAKQGVLLLNNILTVEEGRPKSHSRRGWERFTDHIIESLSDKKTRVVFMLWGSEAQKKSRLIDRTKHLVLESSHPSPLSANKGFLGCNHFSLCNIYLAMTGQRPVDWKSIQ